MSLGFFLSVAVHPPLVQWLIGAVGWREAWLWLGLATWLLLLPAYLLLIQNKPEDLGLQPDGRPPDASIDGAEPPPLAEVGLTSSEAIQTPAFWVIAGSLATFSILLTGLFFHQVSIFASRGLPAGVATGVFSVVAISAVIAVPLFGRLLDRWPTQPIFAAGLLTLSLALVTAALVDGLVSAIVYSIAFGIANAAVHAHLVFLWPRFFGRRHLGSIQGIGQTVSIVGASLGPIPFGLAFDLFGTYDGALWLFALQPAVFAVLVLTMRPPDLTGGRRA
jgi:MFS family permease